MNDVIFIKCKICGGDMDMLPGSSIAKCKCCGSEQTIPKSNDRQILNLFNKANNLLAKCEFDRAERSYENILNLDNTQAEAHWGIVLCKYGVEYVEDLFSDEHIPTCHRTQLESIFADPDFELTLKFADSESKEIYKAEAEKINNIQKRIIEIVKKEKPYDVFICYKRQDEATRERTQDSIYADEIYRELSKEGLRVFFAEVSLNNVLGKEYEPYIYAALTTAKVMLVVGTKVEYFESRWVKNEWSRYIHLMRQHPNEKRYLIPCFKNMDAYDLPKEFDSLGSQGLDIGNIAFMVDILRNVKEILGRNNKCDNSNTAKSNNPESSLLQRSFIFLEDGEFQRADEALEKVLNMNPENARAYIGKLMVQEKISEENDLPKHIFSSPGIDTPLLLRENPEFIKALRFADAEYKQVLEKDILINLEMWYTTGKNELNKGDFMRAHTIFEKISDYRDSSELAVNCILLEKDRRYEKANRCIANREYLQAKKIFTSLGSYKDSINLANKCSILQADVDYEHAKSVMFSQDYAQAALLFESLNGYKDSGEMRQRCLEQIAHLNNQKIEEEARSREQLGKQLRADERRNQTIRTKKTVKITVKSIFFGILGGALTGGIGILAGWVVAFVVGLIINIVNIIQGTPMDQEVANEMSDFALTLGGWIGGSIGVILGIIFGVLLAQTSKDD